MAGESGLGEQSSMEEPGAAPTIRDVAEALLPGGVKGSTADACKDLGNTMLQTGKVADAVWLYTLALDKRPSCHVLHSNRSAAHARLGEWAKALADADQCVQVNATWPRGYSRRAAALEGLGRLDDAIAMHEKVLSFDAGNAASHQAIDAIKEKKRQREGNEDDNYKGNANKVATEGAGEAASTGGDEADPAKEAEERAKAKAEKIQKYKDRGNRAVQAGNFEDAIDNYTTAIEIDAGNHVLYSNRAAAYCSVNQFQSALKDAQKCINLAPKFAKGYGRKATALCGLNRRGEAVQTFHQGLGQCPGDAGLTKGLHELVPAKVEPTEAEEASKKEVAEAIAKAGGGELETEEETQKREAEEALAKKKAELEAKRAALPKLDETEQAMFASFLQETNHLERNLHVERIRQYKLNPFEVLQCEPEMTEDEINVGFRKISLMVHPDKCKHPHAEEAFELCKKALAELQDEEKRMFYVTMMDSARLEAERELKKEKREAREKAKANKKVDHKKVADLRSTFLGGGRPMKRKKEDKEKEEEETFGKADDEDFNQEDKDKIKLKRRDAANRILQRLEKQRSHAEKVFIENEKRSKEALEKLRQDYKKEEKIEEVCVAACLRVWLNLQSRDRASCARSES